jgi:hypothetical protein
MEVITQRLSLDKVKLPEWADIIARQHGGIEFIRKGFSFDDIKFVEGERAAIHAITSTEIDRDGEIVIPKGLKFRNYERNGKPVLWCHQYSSLPLGSCQWLRYDKATNTVLAKTRFSNHQMANDVYEHIKEHPMSSSIGFIPTKWVEKEDYDSFDFKAYDLNPDIAKKARRIYTEAELLEFSLVPVPSNPAACQIAVSKGLLTNEDLKNIGYVYEIIDPFVKGDSDEHKKETEEKEQREEEQGADNSGNGEGQEVEYELELKDEDKFCECEEPDFEDDECRGCGGRRKPRKPKKEFLEEIDDVVGFGEVMGDDPNPLEIKTVEDVDNTDEVIDELVWITEKQAADIASLKALFQEQAVEKLSKAISDDGEVVEKAGRVLSKKTRATIQRAVDALNELIELSDKADEEDEDDDDVKLQDIPIVKSPKLDDIEFEEEDKVEKVVKEVFGSLLANYRLDPKEIVSEAMKRYQGRMF